MRNSRILAAAAVAAALCSCSQSGVSIKGTLEGAPDRTVCLAEPASGSNTMVIDSVRTGADGTFTFKVPAEPGKPRFLYLQHDGRVFASLLVENGENVVVSADSLGRCTVEGSEGSTLLREYNERYARYLRDIDALGEGEPISPVFLAHRKEALGHMLAHPYSLTDIMVLTEEVGGLPTFYEDNATIYFRSVLDSLLTRYPESGYVKQFEQTVLARERNRELNLKIRNAESVGFPDITMPDLNGNRITLSEVDAKVILLHFWTSAESSHNYINNFELRNLYDKYSANGFQIYSVCVDADKNRWASIMNTQKLPWINVNDGNGIYSTALALFNVQQLPTTLVIADGAMQDVQASGSEGLDKFIGKLLK